MSTSEYVKRSKSNVRAMHRGIKTNSIFMLNSNYINEGSFKKTGNQTTVGEVKYHLDVNECYTDQKAVQQYDGYNRIPILP